MATKQLVRSYQSASTPVCSLDFLKCSSQRETHKLTGIGHLFAQHLVN